MKIDDDIHIYMLVRYNKRTEEYTKYRIFFNEYWANKVCTKHNNRNKFPEKYSFHVIKYLLVKV